MDEEKIKKQITFLMKCVDLIAIDQDINALQQSMEELYLSLYDLRKQLIEIIVYLPKPHLAKFAEALDMLWFNKDSLSEDIQEELDVIFFYENIKESISEIRKISWDDLLKINL
ncbi:MAG TPA: hypothetical protein VMZ29_15775 [Candidatus Bathyarchaeia archaeon]|nr:hypothetical protein [Candidatus Bathyarchaeia archaeon]